MGLKTLETKLSLQGALSGASDVSSAGNIKKFARGGFSNGTNGVSNNAAIAPASQAPGSKNSVTFDQVFDTESSSLFSQIEITSQPEVNNKYAINSQMPEPLAIYSFTKDDVKSISAAAYQAYFEDKCSLEFSKALLKKVKQTNDKSLQSLLDKVKEEIKTAEENLQLIEKYLKACLQIDREHNQLKAQAIRSISSQVYSTLNPDKLGLNGEAGYDPFSLLSFAGADKDTLSLKNNTALMTQMLYFAAKQMTNGVSPYVIGEKIYPAGMVGGNETSTFVDVSYGNDKFLNLKSISMSDNVNQSFIYPDLENISYMKKLKVSNFPNVSNFQKAAYLMSMLANEMSISTGLGRLNGTQIGNAFGVSSDYRKRFWGADEQVTDATTEATYPESLNDFFVVSDAGQNRVVNQEGILLFDGSRWPSKNNRSNVFDAFIAGSIREPLSKQRNKVEQFSAAQQAAISRFELGAEFYKILHCRDSNSKLLTPRGLFSRLMNDVSNAMSSFSSEDTAKGQKVVDLCLLSILGRESSTSIDDNSPVSLIKRSLLAVMAKKAIQLQYSLDKSDQKNDSNSSQKPKSVSTSTKVTTKDKDGNPLSTVTVEAETNAASTVGDSAQSAFVPNPKIPRLCENEKSLFDTRLSSTYNNQLIVAFAKMPTSSAIFENTLKKGKLEFNVSKMYESFSQVQNGFLDVLVQIYVDICEESIKICNESSADSSPVDISRLTRNTKIDGTIMLSMLLESACFLASEFVNAKIPNGSEMQLYRFITQNSNSINELIQLSKAAQSSITFNFDLGEKSSTILASRALAAISKASDSDDLSSAFLAQNGNLIVPEMDSLPLDTDITYNSSGAVTVNSIVDTLKALVLEREIPALCLSTTFAMIRHFYGISETYKDMASQLLGIKKQTDQMKILSSFAQDAVGSNFFSSLNDFSLDASKRKLKVVKQETLSESGRNAKLSLGELRCIQLLLSNLSSLDATNNFVVVGMPKDFVTKTVMPGYSVFVDKENTGKDMIMKVKTVRSSIFTNSSSEFDVSLMVRSPFDASSFLAFESREPQDIFDIISNVTIDDKETGYEFIQKKDDQQSAQNVIVNEITSYLLRKLFSTLSSADLFADNINDSEVFAIDPSGNLTAKIFAEAYGLPSSTFDKVFSTTSGGLTYLNEDALLTISRSDFDLAASSLNVVLPILKFGEAELFYDLFETVYFQPNVIARRIFSVSLLDEAVGYIMNSSNFPSEEIDAQKITLEGSIQVSGIQKSLEVQASSRQAPRFDTYFVNILPSDSLVNK